VNGRMTGNKAQSPKYWKYTCEVTENNDGSLLMKLWVPQWGYDTGSPTVWAEAVFKGGVSDEAPFGELTSTFGIQFGAGATVSPGELTIKKTGSDGYASVEFAYTSESSSMKMRKKMLVKYNKSDKSGIVAIDNGDFQSGSHDEGKAYIASFDESAVKYQIAEGSAGGGSSTANYDTDFYAQLPVAASSDTTTGQCVDRKQGTWVVYEYGLFDASTKKRVNINSFTMFAWKSGTCDCSQDPDTMRETCQNMGFSSFFGTWLEGWDWSSHSSELDNYNNQQGCKYDFSTGQISSITLKKVSKTITSEWGQYTTNVLWPYDDGNTAVAYDDPIEFNGFNLQQSDDKNNQAPPTLSGWKAFNELQFDGTLSIPWQSGATTFTFGNKQIQMQVPEYSLKDCVELTGTNSNYNGKKYWVKALHGIKIPNALSSCTPALSVQTLPALPTATPAHSGESTSITLPKSQTCSVVQGELFKQGKRATEC